MPPTLQTDVDVFVDLLYEFKAGVTVNTYHSGLFVGKSGPVIIGINYGCDILLAKPLHVALYFSSTVTLIVQLIQHFKVFNWHIVWPVKRLLSDIYLRRKEGTKQRLAIITEKKKKVTLEHLSKSSLFEEYIVVYYLHVFTCLFRFYKSDRVIKYTKMWYKF